MFMVCSFSSKSFLPIYQHKSSRTGQSQTASKQMFQECFQGTSILAFFSTPSSSRTTNQTSLQTASFVPIWVPIFRKQQCEAKCSSSLVQFIKFPAIVDEAKRSRSKEKRPGVDEKRRTSRRDPRFMSALLSGKSNFCPRRLTASIDREMKGKLSASGTKLPFSLR